jgi:iron complex transport system permease protein
MNTASKSINISLPLLPITIRVSVLTFFFIALLFAIVIASTQGAFNIPISSLLQTTLNEQEQAVFFSIRLPRVLLAIIVGAALAVSGAALQGLFRNPLADPGLIGISSGAAFAVAVMIVIVGPVSGFLGLYGLSFAAFIGCMITSFVLFNFAKSNGLMSVTYILLAGIAVNALAAAGTGFLTYLSDDQQIRTLTFWTMGSLGTALWPSVIISSSIILPACFILFKNAQQLNILILGEDEAEHLGVNSEKLKRTIIICTALSIGGAVAVSGIIGFVGLIVPHLIRLTIGPDHRLLMPASALAGAILLIVADTIARIIVAPAEIPVGIFTSLIGGPFFLWLLVKQYSGRFGI